MKIDLDSRCLQKWSTWTLKKLKTKLKNCHAIFCLVAVTFGLLLLIMIHMLSKDCANLKSDHVKELPRIYVITPTYYREVQKAELVRMANCLMHVKNLHWILVEDSDHYTTDVTRFVRKLRDKYKFDMITHLLALTPAHFKLRPCEPSWKKPKGVWQRNKALSWLRANYKVLDSDGIVYFADDDNTYEIDLFEDIRTTKLVSVWPVGLSGGLMVERPVVDPKTGKVKSFNSMWRPDRNFPIDMAGFSISLRLLVEREYVMFSFNVTNGFMESDFLSHLTTIENLEPKADRCRKVYVWHTRAARPNLSEEKRLNHPSTSGIEW